MYNTKKNKMKKSVFLLILAFAAFVIGCNSGSESTTPAATTPTETPASEQVPPAQENTGDGTSTTITPEATPAPTGDAKLNPPHGEPGHRCDVAVGAPLPM